jgi:hypothetical protein
MYLLTLLRVSQLHSKFHEQRQRRSADRLAAFLRVQAVNGKWNKWILCFERAKRCVVRCQVRWRSKLLCRAAHCALVAHQWRRHEQQQQLAAGYGAAGDGLEAASEASVAREARQWVRARVREHAVALALWEKFELAPLLRATVKARPGLVLLDLASPASWPAKKPTKVDPLQAFLEKSRAAAAARAAEAAGARPTSTPDQSKRAVRRWRFAFRVVDAARTFQAAGRYKRKALLTPAGEALVAAVRTLCRSAPFVEKWGNLAAVLPAPRLLRVMTPKQLARFGEAVRAQGRSDC